MPNSNSFLLQVSYAKATLQQAANYGWAFFMNYPGGDAEDKFLYLDAEYLAGLCVTIPAAAKMPDVVIHDTKRNWLLLIEAVTSAGPVDGKRRRELKQLFEGCTAGLLFVTAFAGRAAMRSFLTQISWETEVWVAEDPEHLIHFDGERFLGPYPDVLPGEPVN